jgi:adenylate kinase
VPDEIIIEMMANAIGKAPDAGFILDGFPRTVNQALELDKTLNDSGQTIDIILNLNVNDDIILDRITGRRSCPQCGAVYHVRNLKPKNDGLCDNDGTELVHRPDDTPEVVANRLETYHEQTEPLVDYYKNKGNVFDIDANRSADEVKNEVFEMLDSLVKT